MEQHLLVERSRFLRFGGMSVVLALMTAACGGYGSSAPSTSASAPNSVVTVGASNNSSLGMKILTDSSGRTLYLFQKDQSGKSLCTGTCTSAWPPLLTKVKAHAGSGVSASLLGTIARNSGSLQVTYNGHPLYTYLGDHSPGQTNGEGLNAFGAYWYAISTLGSAIIGSGNAAGSNVSGSTGTY